MPNSSAIGQQLKFPAWERVYSDWPRDTYLAVIGVVGDMKNKSLRDPVVPQIYLPYTISATGLADHRVLALLTVVGLAACLVPARRATQIDPMTALRHE